MEHFCESCKHNEVCKYKDRFKTKCKEIKNLVENIKIKDNPVVVDIKCKYYWDTIETITSPEKWNDIPDLTPHLDLNPRIIYRGGNDVNYTSSIDPCEGCPNNPALSDTPIVGDSPCQWCAYSPTRVTCANGNTTK